LLVEHFPEKVILTYMVGAFLPMATSFAEFGVDILDASTIHQPCALPRHAWLQ
jgi:hypothetical protein